MNSDHRIQLSGIEIQWTLEDGKCTFEKLPVVMIWVDTSLAGLFSGVQAMVGTPRYLLALQSDGRKSVAEDWKVISQFPDFRDGFKAIANIAAVAGWGQWKLVSLDSEKKECCFRIKDAWEGAYQKALGVCWGSGFLAGKVAGYCTKLFGTNCWADQTAFVAGGDPYDEFVVKPSTRSIEVEMENLLASDEATRADMAVALRKLENEIVERKRTEEMLRESERRYRAIFEGAVEGIIIARLESKRFLYANPAICTMFGYTHDEMTSLGVSDIHPQDVHGAVLRDFESSLPGRKQVVINTPCIRKDGTIFYADIAFGRFFIDGHECNLGFFTDTTERKRAEDALQKAHRLESLGVLAGGIAHDFNNLLLGIFANVDMARSRCAPDEEAVAFLEEAMKVTSRAADLTKQLLTFAKGGAPTRKTGHLAEMVRETTRFALSGSNISCDCDLPENLWQCSFDENQMAQVVQNIILNAQQAMPMGGSIRICAGNVLLQRGEHPSLDEGEFVRLSIQDSGVGIPGEILQKIFDPFFTTKPKGSGLGLATAYSILAKHEGHIDVESEYGKGSTFHI
ncbi:MAG: ATP-binding protein, partial [Planctomycetota bacterium]